MPRPRSANGTVTCAHCKAEVDLDRWEEHLNVCIKAAMNVAGNYYPLSRGGDPTITRDLKWEHVQVENGRSPKGVKTLTCSDCDAVLLEGDDVDSHSKVKEAVEEHARKCTRHH